MPGDSYVYSAVVPDVVLQATLWSVILVSRPAPSTTNSASPAMRGSEIAGAHLSAVFRSPMNFPTTETTQSITYKSAKPMGMITRTGIHLVVQGTNKINGI